MLWVFNATFYNISFTSWLVFSGVGNRCTWHKSLINCILLIYIEYTSQWAESNSQLNWWWTLIASNCHIIHDKSIPFKTKKRKRSTKSKRLITIYMLLSYEQPGYTNISYTDVCYVYCFFHHLISISNWFTDGTRIMTVGCTSIN